MKNFAVIIVILIVWFTSFEVKSQCVAQILTPTADTTICLGDSVYLEAWATCSYLMYNDFNNGTPGQGWTATTGVDFSNPCNPTFDGTIYLWMGDQVPLPRTLTTIDFNVNGACEISFAMKYATQGQIHPCEGPDELDEGITLQYSTNGGGTWVDIAYFRPDGTILPNAIPPNSNNSSISNYNTPFTVWNTYTFSVPPAAQTPSTRFRWIQQDFTTINYDHWGLDQVEIVCPQTQNVVWSNGLTDSLNQWVSPTSTTEYIVAIFDSLGNLATDTILITVIPSPDATFSTSSPVCINQICDISLNGTPNPNVTYTWDFDGGTIASGTGAGPYQVSWSTPGTYTVTCIASEGACQSVYTQTVVVNSDIPVSITPNAPYVCRDSSVVLTANGADYYVWAPSSSLSSDTGTTVIATPTGQTTYTVTGTSIEGCTGTASVTVGIYPDPVITINAYPVDGCKPVFVDFNATVTPGATTYDWNFGDPASGVNNYSTDPNPTHVYAIPGSYDVTVNVISTDGCPGSETFVNMINVYDHPIADFMANPTTANMSNPVINFTDLSSGAYSWYWDFGEIGSPFNYSTLQNPSHTYSAEGTYYVWLIVENEHGCADSTFNVVYIKRDIAFYVPNAFSPHNNDGVNDEFRPYGIGINDETGYYLKIFDRWGKIVFESTDMEYGWDGKINNQDAVPGMYSYFIEVQYSDGLWHKFYGKVFLLE